MKRNSGIALITSLVILVIVAALGLGSMFLTQANLRVSENVRAAALAKQNADTGLNAAFISLWRYAEDNNQRLPEQGSFSLPSTREYELVGYTPYDDQRAMVAIRGLTPSGGRYLTEALVETSGQDDVFFFGYVAGGSIDIPGNAAYRINMWAGNNINLRAGGFVDDFFGQAAGSQCRAGGRCITGVEPPDVPTPLFAQQRSRLLTELGLMSCQADAERILFRDEQVTVECLNSGTYDMANFPSSEIVVIGDTDTTVNMDGRTYRNSVIVAGEINLSNQTSFEDTNTLVSKDNFRFSGRAFSQDGAARTFVISEGDIEFRGSGGSDVFASFWGRNFLITGAAGGRLRGTVTTVGDIDIRGLVSSVELPDIVNPDIPEGSDPGLRVLARR